MEETLENSGRELQKWDDTTVQRSSNFPRAKCTQRRQVGCSAAALQGKKLDCLPLGT
jgi:hypothetical protein